MRGERNGFQVVVTFVSMQGVESGRCTPLALLYAVLHTVLVTAARGGW